MYRRTYWCKHNLIAESNLEIICIAALPPSEFSALKIFFAKHMHEDPSIFENDDYLITFDDLNSDVNFVNNDVLNTFVVNF